MKRGAKRRIHLFSILVATCLLLPSWARAAESPAQRAFAEGVALFHEGRYLAARDTFEKARAAGMNTPVLYYDLGATNFKLGAFDAARQNFLRIIEDPAYGQYARYNLGLIARREQRLSRARARFAQVVAHATDPALRKLAERQLNELGPASPSGPRGVGFLDLESGYDSNVILRRSASTVTPSHQGSALLGVLTGGAGLLQGTWNHGLQMTGTMFYRGYTAVSGYSQLLLTGGPKYRFPVGAWALETAGNVSYFRFGSATLETLLALQVHASHRIGRHGKVTLRGGVAGVRGGSTYSYLSGHTYFAGITGQWRLDSVTLSTGYSHHVDRRDDLRIGTQFFSVSPVADRIFGSVGWRFAKGWKAEIHGSYEHARYRTPDVYTQGGVLVTTRRIDNLASFRVSVSRNFTETLSVELSAEHDSDDSTLVRYGYAQNVYLLRLRYLF